MRLRNLFQYLIITLATATLPLSVYAIVSLPTTDKPCDRKSAPNFTQDAIAKALGWIASNDTQNRCGGYYIDAPIIYPESLLNTDKILIESDQGLFSFHGTSSSQGKITITRNGQQITANRGWLYRDPETGKLSAIDLRGDVRLHEPNQLVVGKQLHYDLKNGTKSFNDILYRATIYGDINPLPIPVSYNQQQQERKITQLSAWGQATTFTQNEPKIYDFSNATYSTCPPTTRVWKVKTKTLELNKNTGRGTATHAFLYLKDVPIFYTPYFNFPIDARRKTGFLFPRIGSSNAVGPYVYTPFYWNLAPNYDTTITPAYLSKRGLQISDLYRYLTPHRSGQFTITALPNDKLYRIFKETSQQTYQNSTSPYTQADLRILENSSPTRKAFSWQDEGRYNKNWSSSVNFNYVGDDYYLRDFSSNLDEVSENQLLQQGSVDYANEHWNFSTRIQNYQTLNQVDQNTVPTVYTRAPQFVLGGSYPDEKYGFQYFINTDLTRFDIRKTPGDSSILPMGVRTHVQPGISRPFTLPYFYLTPRLQLALTQYEIGHVTTNPRTSSRSLPILDVNSGLYFDRNTGWLGRSYKQTLEPQVYYTYIPFKNQNALPVFDTNQNILTYDELFTYNRFSGLDRIGDANQVSLGLTTRFIDSITGYEKITAAIGEIYYFKKRQVTLCSTPENCTAYENNPNNLSIRSPLSGMLKYSATPDWSATANTIWNSKTSRFDNQNLTLQYMPNARKVFNVGYNFVRSGDILLPWEPPGSPTANLSQTDASFAWPISRDWTLLGRWTENWNQRRLQNVVSGLQYDSCCWAIRFVASRIFVALRPNNTFQYNNQAYIEFSLKGLGNYGPNGDASVLLASNIAGYKSNFGRDY
jgi:LPS-assembly protein